MYTTIFQINVIDHQLIGKKFYVFSKYITLFVARSLTHSFKTLKEPECEKIAPKYLNVLLVIEKYNLLL